MEKLWYALQCEDDNDWGNGTYDKAEAIAKLKDSDGYYVRIAVIDGDECVEEITMEDL